MQARTEFCVSEELAEASCKTCLDEPEEAGQPCFLLAGRSGGLLGSDRLSSCRSWSLVTKTTKFRSSQRGFSLVEVLMAITVLSVGLVVVVQAMGRTQQALRLSENLALSSQIADEQMTRLELKAREKGNTYGDDGRASFPGREFEWSSRLQPYQHFTIQDETKINQSSMEVRWKEAGSDRNLRAYSLILKRSSR
jgi:type II secretion system protein I